MTFGERLVTARKEKGLTQKELASLLNISPTRLNYWEKDKRFPPIPMLNSISEILGIDGDFLIGREPKQDEKTSPTPEQSDAGEVEKVDKFLTDLLVGWGYIQSGEDITDADAEFLISWAKVLGAWFKHHGKSG